MAVAVLMSMMTGFVVQGPAASIRGPRASRELRMDHEAYEGGFGDSPSSGGTQFGDSPSSGRTQSARQCSPIAPPRGRLQRIYYSDELTDILQRRDGDKLKVVLFGSRTCPLCRRMAGRMRQVAPKAPGARFYYVEHSAAVHDAFAFHEIHTLPTLCVFNSRGEFEESFMCTPSSLNAFLMEHADALDLRSRRIWGV